MFGTVLICMSKFEKENITGILLNLVLRRSVARATGGIQQMWVYCLHEQHSQDLSFRSLRALEGNPAPRFISSHDRA
jgi:hypothetical protein